MIFKSCVYKCDDQSFLQNDIKLRIVTTALQSDKSQSVSHKRTEKVLRGSAPKKRPMISGSKIESADFYLSSRDYRILF